MFYQSVTQGTRKKILSSPNRSRTYCMTFCTPAKCSFFVFFTLYLVSNLHHIMDWPAGLPLRRLSYRRLVGADWPYWCTEGHKFDSCWENSENFLRVAWRVTHHDKTLFSYIFTKLKIRYHFFPYKLLRNVLHLARLDSHIERHKSSLERQEMHLTRVKKFWNLFTELSTCGFADQSVSIRLNKGKRGIKFLDRNRCTM